MSIVSVLGELYNISHISEINVSLLSGLFPSIYTNCLATNCPTELSSAESLAQQFCKLSNSTSTSLSFPSIPVATTTSTSVSVTGASGAGSSTSATSPTAGSTATNSAVVDTGMGIGLLVTVLGVILGAYLVD